MDPKPPYPPPPPGPPDCSPKQPPVPPAPPPRRAKRAPQRPDPTSLIVGGASLGSAFPFRPDPGIPNIDGRTVSLSWLGRYLAHRTYARTGEVGASPVFFRFPEENFFVDPPGPENDLPYPAIACAGGESEDELIGFTPAADESTIDVYGQGTVAVPMYATMEKLRLQIWSSTLPEMRGLYEGVKESFSPTEGRTGIVVRLPDYYGQTARFTLTGSEWPTDPGSVRNRRWAFVSVTLEFDVTRLVRYARLIPQVVSDVQTTKTSNPLVSIQMPTGGGSTGQA